MGDRGVLFGFINLARVSDCKINEDAEKESEKEKAGASEGQAKRNRIVTNEDDPRSQKEDGDPHEDEHRKAKFRLVFFHNDHLVTTLARLFRKPNADKKRRPPSGASVRCRVSLEDPLLGFGIEEVALGKVKTNLDGVADPDLVSQRNLSDQVDAGEVAVDIILVPKELRDRDLEVVGIPEGRIAHDELME